MGARTTLATVLRIRHEAYGVFELLAWPAVVWSSVEIVLRTAVAEYGGMADATLILACALMTVGVARYMRSSRVIM